MVVTCWCLCYSTGGFILYALYWHCRKPSCQHISIGTIGLYLAAMSVNRLFLDSINPLFFCFFHREDSLSGCWFYHHLLMRQSWLKCPPAWVSVTNIDLFHSGITSWGATETRQSVTTVLLWLLLATSFTDCQEREMAPGVWLWWSEQTTSLETMQLSPASSHPCAKGKKVC